jgi:large subunit ribosomal protein L29
MKKKELSLLTESELDKLAHDTREEIGKLRFQKALGQLDNSHLMREKRRLIARIETLSQIKKVAKK